MTTQEIKKIESEMFKNLSKKCGLFWAFSNQQFEDNKTPLQDGDKYVSVGGGGYLPKSNVQLLIDGQKEIKNHAKQLRKEIKKPVYDVADFEPDPDKLREYEARQAEKTERYNELAEKAEKKSDDAYKTAKQIGDFNPTGQHILVGHHSETRHPQDLDPIDSNMRKSIELDEKAKYYKQKAANAENSNVISSDDPAAVVKLIEKLNELEKRQEFMKSANKIIKNKKLHDAEKVDQLQKMGISEKSAIGLLEPDFCGRVGFAGYQLTNNNANIRSTRQRIEHLRKQQTQETKEFEINGVSVVDNVEDNRLKIFFDYIPQAKIKTE